MRWRDGSLVHVQVTGEVHRQFCEALKVATDNIQKRIAWLKSGSRELFGSILENNIYIVIDISQSMAPSIKFVKDKLFQLMQEQLRHKAKFNLVTFNTKVFAWKTRMAPVCEQTLLNAWQWIKNIDCAGSTNTMAAVDYAMGDPDTEAVYLLTDGRPDQPGSAVIAQATHRRVVPVHTISFNCYDSEANQFLADLARVTNGRFHAFSSSGDIIVDPYSDEPEPWESEDVRLLKKELALAREYADTMTQLRKECISLAWNRDTHRDKPSKQYQPNVVGTLVGNRSASPFDRRMTRSATTPSEYAFKPQPDRMVLIKPSKGRPNIARHTKSSILRLVKDDDLSPKIGRRSPTLGIRPAYLGAPSDLSDDSDDDDDVIIAKYQASARRTTRSVSSVSPISSSYFKVELNFLNKLSRHDKLSEKTR